MMAMRRRMKAARPIHTISFFFFDHLKQPRFHHCLGPMQIQISGIADFLPPFLQQPPKKLFSFAPNFDGGLFGFRGAGDFVGVFTGVRFTGLGAGFLATAL